MVSAEQGADPGRRAVGRRTVTKDAYFVRRQFCVATGYPVFATASKCAVFAVTTGKRATIAVAAIIMSGPSTGVPAFSSAAWPPVQGTASRQV